MKNPSLLLRPSLALAALSLLAALPLGAQANKEQIVDLSAVPQLSETPAQREARLAWFKDAKFGMFIHWGPCTVGGKEIGWGRAGNRPWDINKHGPRTEDPEYDSYYKTFNPVKFDADAWVRVAKEAGMKYMVLIAKHHDGFSQYDTKLSDYDIMATPYGRDIVKQFTEACHRAGMRAGLYYSTRDWYHPDYLVGDNAKYDAFYRGQIEELLSNYGKIDVLWFDHVGGRDWGKWRLDQLFASIYRLQPGILVNNRAAAFIGPKTPEDRGPASPEIRQMTYGDFNTPEQQIGAMNLNKYWESCMILSPTPRHDGWSWRPEGVTRPLEDCIHMLVSSATGGGNLLLNFGPDQFGEFRPEEVAIAKGMGAWLQKYGDAIYATRGGPYTNGGWGGATHRGNEVYVFARDLGQNTLRLAALPQKITSASLFLGGTAVPFRQSEAGVELELTRDQRDTPFTVVRLVLDQPVPEGQLVGAVRSRFDDPATYGKRVLQAAAIRLSSASKNWKDTPADHPKLLTDETPSRAWSFHTAAETTPYVELDLGAVTTLSALTIVNVPQEKRTAPLVVLLSSDGQTWTEVHRGPLARDYIDVPLTTLASGAEVPGRPARYLRVQAEFTAKPDTLGLAHLQLYAKP